MRTNLYAIGLAVLSLVASTSGVAEACSCLGVAASPAAFRTADVVFVATVEGLVPRAGSRKNADGSISGWVSSGFLTATLRVQREFRGAVVGTVDVAGSGTTCDEPFAVGEIWLIYANWRDGRLTTSKCTRSRVLAGAAQDLAYLDNREQMRPQAVLFGDVFHAIVSVDGAPALQIPFEPLDVVANGAGKRFRVTTDRWGPYELVLPPGEFDVWVERRGQPVTARTRIVLQDDDERRITLSAQYD